MHFFLSNQTEYVYLHCFMIFLIKKENMKIEMRFIVRITNVIFQLRFCFIFYYIHFLFFVFS